MNGTPGTLTCSLTELEAAVTISWYHGDDGPIQTDPGGEYSAKKLQGGDVLKSMILGDERLIVSRCWGGY